MKAVITQIALVSPFGSSVEVFVEKIRSGSNAFDAVRAFSTEGLCSSIAAEVLISRTTTSTRVQQLLDHAFDEYPWLGQLKPSTRRAVLVGTTKGELELTLGGHIEDPVSPFVARLALRTNSGGPAQGISVACASSTQAIADAAALIEDGICDEVLVVGIEGLHSFVYQGFHSLKALAPNPSKPFDAQRQGLTLGEGCAVFLLQRESLAKAQGQNILGRVPGYGSAADGHDQTAPHPEARGLSLAVEKALRHAAMTPDQIDRYHAHGTGTWHNDATEAVMCKTIFGVRKIPVMAIKGHIGHTLGAAGAFDVAATLLSMNGNEMWPVANTQSSDPTMSIDLCLKLQRCDHQKALIGTAGFGGLNVALILEKGAA